MEKNKLREYMKSLRSSTNMEVRELEDSIVFNKVINSKYYKEANIIMIYVSFGFEVGTKSIIDHALENNKIVCVPKVINRKDGMKAIKIESYVELKRSKFGILEPESLEKEIYPKDIDLFLIPGLAFDNKGGRLGYGAGYYDRFLNDAKKSSNKIGLAYTFQVIEEVPMFETDIKLNNIITGEYTKQS